jgi:hypothetical protein
LGTKSSTMLDDALNAASTGSVIKRVTIVATRPDTSFLYVRADYSSQTDTYARPLPPSYATTPDEQDIVVDTATAAPRGGGALVPSSVPARNALVVGSISSTANRDAYGNFQSMNRSVEQYARTQRILADPSEPARVDVHA